MSTDTVAGRSMPERAVDLHERGWSFRRIARKLGIPKSTAFDYVSGEYGDGAKMQVKREVRQAIERARLDRVAARASRLLQSSDEKVAVMAGALLVKVSESRRKLDGLDAPTKVETKQVEPDEYAKMSRVERIEALKKAIDHEQSKQSEEIH